jgi:hypothetical protein
MTLHVNVPVLSEKTYLTYPSSSLIEEQFTLIAMPYFSSNINKSYYIKKA